jgi:hypothetical protein
LQILQFYDEHGEAKTKKYFGVNRKTVWTWKHKLVTARGQLAAWIPQSTRPKRVHRRGTDPHNLRREMAKKKQTNVKRETRSPAVAPAAVPAAVPADSAPEVSFPIVGIGASAGGLAAIEAFFAAMPPDTENGRCDPTPQPPSLSGKGEQNRVVQFCHPERSEGSLPCAIVR